MTTLATRLSDFATRIATEAKAIRTLLNGNAADLSALTTTNKTTVVAALNELRASMLAIIDDTATTSTTKTFSVDKIVSLINAAVAGLVNSSPAALDTLKELADAIGDDASFAATINAALGNRVRVDAAQALTAGQKAQARANIGADITTADTGDVTVDLVGIFTTGLI